MSLLDALLRQGALRARRPRAGAEPAPAGSQDGAPDDACLARRRAGLVRRSRTATPALDLARPQLVCADERRMAGRRANGDAALRGSRWVAHARGGRGASAQAPLVLEARPALPAPLPRIRAPAGARPAPHRRRRAAGTATCTRWRRCSPLLFPHARDDDRQARAAALALAAVAAAGHRRPRHRQDHHHHARAGAADRAGATARRRRRRASRWRRRPAAPPNAWPKACARRRRSCARWTASIRRCATRCRDAAQHAASPARLDSATARASATTPTIRCRST